MTRWFCLSLAMTAAAFAILGYVCAFQYDALPARVPTHWNINFDVDGWTPKESVWKMFLIPPAVMAAMCVLGQLLPWLSPQQFKVDTFRGTWDYTMMLVVGLMGFLHLALIWAAFSQEQHKSLFMRLFLGAMCLFFALLGNVMGKVRRNFWMGIRTPWTLASNTVWYHTHRLAAKLFFGAGLGGCVLVMLIPVSWIAWGFGLVMVAIMAAAFIPVGYSLTLYKRLEREGKLDLEQQAPSPS